MLGTEISDEQAYIVHGNNSDSVTTMIIYCKYHKWNKQFNHFFLNDESSQHYPVLQVAHKFSTVLCDMHLNQ